MCFHEENFCFRGIFANAFSSGISLDASAENRVSLLTVSCYASNFKLKLVRSTPNILAPSTLLFHQILHALTVYSRCKSRSKNLVPIFFEKC